MSFNRSIFKISTINVFNSIFVLANSVVIAQLFGTSRNIELFFAARIVVNMAINLSLAGTFAEIILPIYHRSKAENGLEGAQRMISSFTNIYLVIISILAMIMIIAAPIIIKVLTPGFTAENHILGVSMIRVLSPLLVFMFFNGQIKVLLNAEQKYGRPEIISTINLIIRPAIIFVGFSTFDIWILIISLWIVTVMESVMLLFLYKTSGNRYYFKVNYEWVEISPHLKLVWSTFPNILISQSTNIIINSQISMLPAGVFAIFNYAEMIVKRIQSIFSKPILTVFFSKYSLGHSLNESDIKTLIRSSLSKYLKERDWIFSPMGCPFLVI